MSPQATHPAQPRPGQGSAVLVADDDPISRDMLALLLRSAGFTVDTASDGQDALDTIRRRGRGSFDILFSDIQMPRIGGFELLSRVNDESPATATVIVTGNRERELVSASLRGGAVEFLDKPFDLPSVLRAALRARDTHRHRRQQLAAQLRLREVADIHHRLNRSSVLEESGLPAKLTLHTRFQTLNEAGGDLVKVLALPPDRVLLVLGDVSGHGLKEGFLAAYFQGVIQGMGIHAAGAREMAEAFNDFLQTRWNDASPLAVNNSLGASFVELDLRRRLVSTLDCGGTGARLGDADGSLQVLPGGGCPLGWYPQLEAVTATAPLPPSGHCWLWSDGLEEHAARLQLPPLVLAWRILLHPETAPPDPLLAGADDDIVVCRLDWQATDHDTPAWLPLHLEDLPGDASDAVDPLHENWERLLPAARPTLAGAPSHDIALCAREALLNALVHGCAARPDRRARLAFLLSPDARRLLLRIDDEGDGFDPANPPPTREPGHVSLGLRLIRSLAASVTHSPDGRRLEILFDLPPP